jgi:hypothetical protein
MHHRCQSRCLQVIDNKHISQTPESDGCRHPPSKTVICRPLAFVSVTEYLRQALNSTASRNKPSAYRVNNLSALPSGAKTRDGIWDNTSSDMKCGGLAPLSRLIA